MELIISLAISTFITAIAYLFVPVIFCVIGYKTNRSYSLSTIRKIVIINGACVWLIFQVIRINAGETGISGAIFLWSVVAYWLMKKFLLQERANKPHEENYYKDPINPFQHIDRKDKRYKATIVVISLLLALSCCLNIYQFGRNENSNEKLEFYDECIVFVEDDGTDLYHIYECDRFKGDYFWAYNIEQAEYRGYKPCPICHRN